LFAISSRIAVMASVSIRSVSARVRRITAPVARPRSAESAAAARSCKSGSLIAVCAPSAPAV
jgi:hypothetical protein